MEQVKKGLVDQMPIKDQGGHKRDENRQMPKAAPVEPVSKGGISFKIK